jgi:hypothetical protein
MVVNRFGASGIKDMPFLASPKKWNQDRCLFSIIASRYGGRLRSILLETTYNIGIGN